MQRKPWAGATGAMHNGPPSQSPKPEPFTRSDVMKNTTCKLAVLLIVCCIPMAAQQSAGAAAENSITNIYDVLGAQKAGTIQDWGFAAFIRYNGKNILFDTGMDPDILEHNAKALGIDLASVDIAVLSHTHNDHASGFPYFLKVNSRARIYLPDDLHFFAAPGVLLPGARAKDAELPVEEQYYGGQKPKVQIKPAGIFAGRAGVEAVEQSLEIFPGAFLIHTTSPLTGLFNGYPPHTPDKPHLEPMPELSLALKTARGFVIVTGCSHSRVEEIVTATKKTTGGDVDLVEGGFHLIGYQPAEIAAVANKLKDDLGVRRAAPTHCTGETAIATFRQIYGENYVRAGLGSVIKF